MNTRTIFPLPLTLEQIDAAWVSAALRSYAPGVEVRACETVDVKRGTCTKVRLRLDLNDAAIRAGIPPTVILKGGFEPHSRAMASMHDAEVHGYKDTLPTLGLLSPRAYFAEFDAASQQGIVIMEDLVVGGATFCNPLVPQGKEEVARRLSALATFHAKTWNSSVFSREGKWSWLNEIMALTNQYAGPYLEPDTWQRFIVSPRGAAASVRFHDAAWMADALRRVGVLSSRSAHCVLHSDTHVGNLYVSADGQPGFFDSLPSYGPSLIEVSYNVVCALDPADRPRWERDLIRHYLEELTRNGVEALPLDEAMRQFGIYLARAYFIFVINEAFFQNEAINTAYTARISAAMLDHDTIGLLQTIR